MFPLSEGRRYDEHVLPTAEGDHGVCPGQGQGGDSRHHEGEVGVGEGYILPNNILIKEN